MFVGIVLLVLLPLEEQELQVLDGLGLLRCCRGAGRRRGMARGGHALIILTTVHPSAAHGRPQRQTVPAFRPCVCVCVCVVRWAPRQASKEKMDTEVRQRGGRLSRQQRGTSRFRSALRSCVETRSKVEEVPTGTIYGALTTTTTTNKDILYTVHEKEGKTCLAPGRPSASNRQGEPKERHRRPHGQRDSRVGCAFIVARWYVFEEKTKRGGNFAAGCLSCLLSVLSLQGRRIRPPSSSSLLRGSDNKRLLTRGIYRGDDRAFFFSSSCDCECS